MATEIWHAFGEDAPVTLIPVADGRLELTANVADRAKALSLRTTLRDAGGDFREDIWTLRR
jgi:hypothetical protein